MASLEVPGEKFDLTKALASLEKMQSALHDAEVRDNALHNDINGMRKDIDHLEEKIGKEFAKQHRGVVWKAAHEHPELKQELEIAAKRHEHVTQTP